MEFQLWTQQPGLPRERRQEQDVNVVPAAGLEFDLLVGQALGVFAAVYTLATFALVLDEYERTRIKGMLLRGARLATPTQDGPVIGEDQEPDQ